MSDKPKNPNIITVPSPKQRDLNVIAMRNRGGKGPHKDRKKEADKKACRIKNKGSQDED